MQNMNQPQLPATVLAKKLVSEMETAISIKSLLVKFAHDERIDEVFNDTYESHAFNLIEATLVYALTMNLMRIHDTRKRNDIYSLRVLFDDQLPINNEKSGSGKDNVLFDEARKLYERLKRSHLLSRTKVLRDRFIAHSGILDGKEKLPKYSYLYDLLHHSSAIVENIGVVILREHRSFEKTGEIWDDYSSKFFESLIQGQKLTNSDNGLRK